MAVTEPTAPIPVSISVATTPLRTVTCDTKAQFDAALADATYGDWILLTPGHSFTGEFVLRSNTAGSTTGIGGDNYVTIMSSAYASLPASGTRVTLSDASNMPTIVATSSATSNRAMSNAGPALHHYRFVGIRFTTPAILGYEKCFSIRGVLDTGPYPHHISVERCILDPHYDYGCQKGFEIDGYHIQYLDCYITNCKQTNQADANAIAFYYSKGPHKVHNCLIEGMGENLFFGGASNSGVPVTSVASIGYEYETPCDITITNNYIRRPLSWLRNHSTYIPQCDTAGTATILSATATTVTFSGSQTLSGSYIKGVTSGAVAKVTSNGAACNVTYRSGSDFTDGESFRYNSGDLHAKNLLELKAGQRVLIEGNILENGWTDGQNTGGNVTLSPIEFGWLSDIAVKKNKFINCSGFFVNSANTKSGFLYGGPAPRTFQRLLIEDNLLQHQTSLAAQPLFTYDHGMYLGVNQDTYGKISTSMGGTITAAVATVGSGRTFTSTGTANDYGAFASWMVGLTIKYSAGEGIIASYVDKDTIRVDISTAWPDTSAHGTELYSIGPASIIGTDYAACDSWVVRNNTFAGDCAYIYAIALADNQQGRDTETFVKTTNFEFKDNILHHGAYPGTGGGFAGVIASSGGGTFQYGADNVLTQYNASPTFTKDVFFGAQLNSGVNYKTFYSTVDGGTNPVTNDVTFHDPDHTGSNAGGAIGFADYAGGDYAISGSPYATWGTDGTPPGCDIGALNAAIANVITGAAPVTGTREYAFVRIG